jgi:hypothetical protein
MVRTIEWHVYHIHMACLSHSYGRTALQTALQQSVFEDTPLLWSWFCNRTENYDP